MVSYRGGTILLFTMTTKVMMKMKVADDEDESRMQMKSPSVTSSVKGDIVDSSRSTTTTRHGPKSWNPQLKVSAQVPLVNVILTNLSNLWNYRERLYIRVVPGGRSIKIRAIQLIVRWDCYTPISTMFIYFCS